MALVRLITNVATGKTDPSAIYARIKNGSVYKLRAEVDPRAVPSVIAKIEAAGKIRIGGTEDGVLWLLQNAPRSQPASVITWAESAAIDDGPAPCLSSGDATITSNGWLAGQPQAPRFQYFEQFKAKCDELAHKGNHEALETLHAAKERKAHALRTQFEVFQKTMHDTESDWEELDRIQRVMEVVEAERDYVADMLAAPYEGWEDDDADIPSIEDSRPTALAVRHDPRDYAWWQV